MIEGERMSELVQTDELLGSVTGTQSCFDVAGIPSMPYTQYTVETDGETTFVNGPLSDDPRYVRFSIGDTIPVTRKTYKTPSGNHYKLHQLTLA